MKTFLQSFLGAGCAVVAVVLVGAFLLVLFLAAGFAGAFVPPLPAGDVLVLDLSRPLVEHPGRFDPLDMLRRAAQGLPAAPGDLPRVLHALERAAEDDDVAALYVTGTVTVDTLGAGWGTLADLRAGVERFAASGKPVLAYLPFCSEADLYVASAAPTVLSSPFGFVEWNGLAADGLYFARLLEKVGVEVQVVRRGDYKSAVEPFTRAGRSPEDREQMENLLGDLQAELDRAVAAARGMDVARLARLATERGLWRGDEAAELGLVDGVATVDEVHERLAELADVDVDSLDLLDVARYARVVAPSMGGEIAVVVAEGVITDLENPMGVGGRAFAEELDRLRDDDSVEAVVLRVNSPGGSAWGSELVLQSARRLAREKPLVVSMGSVAASGGYWISLAGQRVLAEPATITGSIGVLAMVPSVEGLLDEIGVDVDTVRTRPHAEPFSILSPLDETELASLDSFVGGIYQGFLERVAEARGLPIERVEEIAGGAVWSGVDALELGLVDALGGLEEAIAAAAELAGLEEWSVSYPQAVVHPFDALLLQSLDQGPVQGAVTAAEGPLARLAREAFATADEVARSPVQARMPFELRIR